MLDLEILHHQPLVKFNQQLPFFNWHYPFDRPEDLLGDRLFPYAAAAERKVRRRALYFHIPFCETICNFCPFSRDKYQSGFEVVQYLYALVTEIEFKRQLLGRCSVDAIFVGGGTPSLLNPSEIERLGEAIHRNFDLRSIGEFTFEVEVKSVSKEKLQAMRDIGANRVSFGAQTFSRKYRTLFSLDASLEQIYDAAGLLTSMFPYTNVDLLYGMAGQSQEELLEDVLAAVSLKTTTIDVYPLNNLTAPRAMHAAASRAGLDVLPEYTRVQLRIYVEKIFREFGYRPISGYSFSPASKTGLLEKVQHEPKFLYHDLVYGYHDDEIIGYGSSAISQIPGFNMYNFSNRQAYVSELISKQSLPHKSYGSVEAPERGVVSFPYRGSLNKIRVPWKEVPDDTLAALEQAQQAGLIFDQGDRYTLTDAGWLFYVNLMYYLMPESGKVRLSEKIELQKQKGHDCGNTDLMGWAHSGLL